MSRNNTSSRDSTENHDDYQNSETEESYPELDVSNEQIGENSTSDQDSGGNHLDFQDSDTDEGRSQPDDNDEQFIADSLGISLKSYELLTEYRNIAGLNNNHSDGSTHSYDSQNNDYGYNGREDPDEITYNLVIFFFQHRDEDGMDGLVEYLREEDEDFDYRNDLRFLLSKASELEITEILEYLDEEITDEDLGSLDSDYIESLRDGNCSRIRNLWKVKNFCKLMGTDDYFYDPLDIEDYMEERDFAKIIHEYLSHIKDYATEDSGLAKDLINFIEYFDAFCTEINIWDIFYILVQRVAEKYDYLDDLCTIVENYYLIEVTPKRVILELQKLFNKILAAEGYDLAIKLYDLLELVDQNIFIGDLRLCDMFEASNRDYDALKHYIKCSDDRRIEAEEYDKDDDSTDSENIQTIKRGYDILERLELIEDEFKAAFIVKSIGKSIIFSTEVVNQYQYQKKEIKSKKTPYTEILKKWIKVALKEALSQVTNDKKQITKKKIKQVIEQILSETKFLRYYRILAAITTNSKDDYLDGENQDNKQLHQIDQEKIKNIVKTLFGIIDLDKFIKLFNGLLIDNFKKLLNDDTQIEITRDTLSNKKKYNLENRNELDFFSNLRLLRISALRRMRSKKGQGDFTYNFDFPIIEDVEDVIQITQKISKGNALDYHVLNSGTYSDVYEKVLKIKELGISDQDIARFVRQMLLGNKYLVKGSKKFSHKKIKEISQLIAEITVLIFAVEGSRNNSSFIINQMMLDLIEVGKMTWQQAIKDEEMPMAMNGAVKISRAANIHFSEQLPYEYRHPGPTAKKIKKLSDNQVLEKEDRIIKKWLTAFYKSDKPISNRDLCSMIHNQIIIWYPRINPQNLASYPKKQLKNKKLIKEEGETKLSENKEPKQPQESKKGQKKLKIHPISEDGNCMYNAVLEGIKILPNYDGNQDITLSQLRQNIANEINQNIGDYFDLLVTQIVAAIRDQDIVGFIGEVSKDIRSLIIYRCRSIDLGSNIDEIDQVVQNRVETQGVVQHYIDMIEQDQAWGGGVELSIMSRLLNIQIIVHRPDMEDIIVGTNNNQIIELDYNGTHYNLILTKGMMFNQNNRELGRLSITGVNSDKDKKSSPDNSPTKFTGSPRTATPNTISTTGSSVTATPFSWV